MPNVKRILMSASARAEPEGAVAQAAPPAGNLDQVREILFGAHYRELERKLLRLEGHIASQGNELRGEARRLVQALETHVNKEIEAVGAQRDADRSAQMDALSHLAREARDTALALEQRITKLEDGLARSQREFRQQILEEAKGFVEQTRSLREELGAMLQRELAMYLGELPEAPPASGVIDAASQAEPAGPRAENP